MAHPAEIARDIVVAWLGAYENDPSARRQKGAMPNFVPTYEEVVEFYNRMYQVAKEAAGEATKVERPARKKEKQD